VTLVTRIADSLGPSGTEFYADRVTI